MARGRKATKIHVKVLDQGKGEGGRRTLQVEISAERELFITSDFCAAAGVVPPLNKLLESGIREVLQGYIKSGTEFMQKAKAEVVGNA